MCASLRPEVFSHVTQVNACRLERMAACESQTAVRGDVGCGGNRAGVSTAYRGGSVTRRSVARDHAANVWLQQ